MRIYIAAPFFSAKQVALVEEIEGLVAGKKNLSFFSPRSEGVIAGKTREERAKMAPLIFSSNCNHISDSQLVFAVIDDRDAGVIWEIGYACAKAIPIVTYTNENYGLNVMIREGTIAHVKGMAQARQFFQSLSESNSIGRAVLPWRHVDEAAT